MCVFTVAAGFEIILRGFVGHLDIECVITGIYHYMHCVGQ